MGSLNVFINHMIIEINASFELASGGEGTVYEIDSNTVAKIYHDGIKPIDVRKFKFLKKLDQNYFVSPLDIVHDDNGRVIGYTMKYVDQSFFPLSNVYSKKFCQNNGIDKKVKLKIIERLIAAVKYAHQQDVIIGDLNPYNILVNNQGVVRLIDTDSYETPGFPHSHILLDEIRDYYYQGRVSKESDFFALSILAFNMLAFLHPFKGMHKTYKKLGDRMIQKLPVFVNDPAIKIPKCYEPITDNNFLSQFKKFYLSGERFLLSLTGVDDSIIATSPLQKPSLIKKYEQDDMIITMIMQESELVNVFFTSGQGIIQTKDEFIVYNSKNKGYLNQKFRVNSSDWDRAFIGNENFIVKKGSELYHYNNGKFERLSNFEFPSKYIISQMDNILIVIGEDEMYKLFIDEIGAGTIMTQRVEVFGRGFSNHTGLIHNSAGKQNILFNSGNNISIVQSPVSRILGINQVGNVGMIKYTEKNKVRHKMFKIDGLKMKLSNFDFDNLSNISFIPSDKVDGVLFLPSDDKIEMYRTQDFEKIGELSCNIISSEGVLYKTDSGIVSWEGNNVALLNKK